MTEAELRELIRRTIEEILNPPPRRALVLFTGALLGFEASLEGLRRIAADGVELDYVQTPSATRILDQDKIAALGMTEVSRKLVAEHQMLIVPTLTVNTAAKAAHAVADCLATNLFQEFVMANRPIVAVRTAACPDSPEKRDWFPNMPAGFAAVLRENLTRLDSFGVRLCSAARLHETVMTAWADHLGAPGPVAAVTPATPVASVPAATPAAIECHRTLISHGVVQPLPVGSLLRIEASAKVTAMARDAASSRSIRIERRA
ncbi:MAG: flavoprotein [Propionicimonas sp.]